MVKREEQEEEEVVEEEEIDEEYKNTFYNMYTINIFKMIGL